MTPAELLTPDDVIAILGCTKVDLKNWRRPHILKGKEANPRYLPAIPDPADPDNPQKPHLYRRADIVRFLRHPEKGVYREQVLAALLPDEYRRLMLEGLGMEQPA